MSLNPLPVLHSSSLVAITTHTTYLFLSHLGDFGWGIIWSLIVTLGSFDLDLGFSCFFRIAFRYTWPIWTFLVWLVWLAWLHGFWARLLFIGFFYYYFFSFSFLIIIHFLLVIFLFILFSLTYLFIYYLFLFIYLFLPFPNLFTCLFIHSMI